jgi:hypothetical protein
LLQAVGQAQCRVPFHPAGSSLRSCFAHPCSCSVNNEIMSIVPLLTLRDAKWD